MSIKIDRTTRGNIDRVDRQKADRLRKVRQMPSRVVEGGFIFMEPDEKVYIGAGGRWLQIAGEVDDGN